MVSAQRGRPIRRGSRSQSVESWSWYSSSQVDLMLMSRKRANSFELLEPHPSTMLKATDSEALIIWALSDPRSLRGNVLIARRTLSTSSCALCHTNNRRKSCMPISSRHPTHTRHPFAAAPPKSFRPDLCGTTQIRPPHPLGTTDDCPTNQLTTQNLNPLRQTGYSPRRYAAGIQ
jgi:hypothetical protein